MYEINDDIILFFDKIESKLPHQVNTSNFESIRGSEIWIKKVKGLPKGNSRLFLFKDCLSIMLPERYNAFAHTHR